MSKLQPSNYQYRKETRYFIRKYGRLAFFKACAIVNLEQSKRNNCAKQKATKNTVEQLMNACYFSATDAQRFILLAPLQAEYSEQHKPKRRSVHQ